MNAVDVGIFACSVGDIFAHPAFPELWAAAGAECANPDLSAVSPDEDFYRTLEKSGATRCFGVGCADSLHGFALLLLSRSGANGKMYATVERLFVRRELRRQGAGARMMEAIEEAARKEGCEAIFYSAHAGSSLARLLFLQSDLYPLTNHIFCRRLS